MIRKMYKSVLLGLCAAALSMALGACGSDSSSQVAVVEPESLIQTQESVASTQESAAEPVAVDAGPFQQDDSQPPREGMVRSRLTNEWVDADIANSKPIAVATPNESSAIPHYNLSQASILYEADVEGNMTRMLAIYEDWKNLDKIGNVRSLRAYFAYWAMEWEAFIVHIGGPYFIDEVVTKPNVSDIDGKTGAAGAAFFRTKDRKAPHNAYALGSGIEKVALQKGYSLEYEGLADAEHFQFTPRSNPNTLEQYSDAVNASKVDLSSAYRLTRCYFEFNEADGLYYRFQHLSGKTDGPHIDGANNQQLSFANVIVQNAVSDELGEGYLAFQVHDRKGQGYYFTQGKGIPITWTKTTDFGATRYYDMSGKEITLNTGKTMICVIRDNNKVIFQ